jgi:hypothetical protein
MDATTPAAVPRRPHLGSLAVLTPSREAANPSTATRKEVVITRPSISRSLRRTATAAALAVSCLAVGASAQPASAAPYVGIPAAAAGSHNLGWSSDVEATCLFSRSLFVTTGQQIDVTLPDELKAASFYARPWMKIVNASGTRWVTLGWQHVAPSTDNGYPIKFSWSVRGARTYFYPAIELYFPNERVRTFSVAVTKLAGILSGGSTRPCYLGG